MTNKSLEKRIAKLESLIMNEDISRSDIDRIMDNLKSMNADGSLDAGHMSD